MHSAVGLRAEPQTDSDCGAEWGTSCMSGERVEHLQQSPFTHQTTNAEPDSPIDWSVDRFSVRRINVPSAFPSSSLTQEVQVYKLMYYDVTEWMLLLGALLFIQLRSQHWVVFSSVSDNPQAGCHVCVTLFIPSNVCLIPLLIPSNRTGWWEVNVSSSRISDQMSATIW